MLQYGQNECVRACKKKKRESPYPCLHSCDALSHACLLSFPVQSQWRINKVAAIHGWTNMAFTSREIGIKVNPLLLWVFLSWVPRSGCMAHPASRRKLLSLQSWKLCAFNLLNQVVFFPFLFVCQLWVSLASTAVLTCVLYRVCDCGFLFKRVRNKICHAPAWMLFVWLVQYVICVSMLTEQWSCVCDFFLYGCNDAWCDNVCKLTL